MASLIIKVRQVCPFGHHPIRLTVEEGAELIHVGSLRSGFGAFHTFGQMCCGIVNLT